MKYMILIITIVILFTSCSRVIDSSFAQKHQVKLKMKEVVFYGDTVTFEATDTTFLIANTDNITEINLGKGSTFGVKVNVFPMQGDTLANHAYQVIFYEKEFDKWKAFNSHQMFGKQI